MRTRIVPLAITLLAALAASPAQAAPITYEFTGTLSGTLGGAAFADAPVRFTLTADSAGITSVSSGPVPFRQTFTTAGAPLAFTIDGVDGTFLDPFHVFSFTFAPGGVPGPAIGTVGVTPEGPNNGSDLFSLTDFPLAFYDLATPFGPFTQAPPDFLNSGEAYPTTAGDLILDDTGTESLTFRAFAGAAAVPEPATAASAGLGALALALTVRRRRARP